MEIIKKNYKFEKFKCKDCSKYFQKENKFTCSQCKKDICNQCFRTGLKYGKKYRYLDNYCLCDQCCWWEIT